MFGRRASSVAGPAAWNSLPDYLRDPTRSVVTFRRDLKTFLHSTLGASRLCATNLLLTLTYVYQDHDLIGVFIADGPNGQ